MISLISQCYTTRKYPSTSKPSVPRKYRLDGRLARRARPLSSDRSTGTGNPSRTSHPYPNWVDELDPHAPRGEPLFLPSDPEEDEGDRPVRPPPRGGVSDILNRIRRENQDRVAAMNGTYAAAARPAEAENRAGAGNGNPFRRTADEIRLDNLAMFGNGNGYGRGQGGGEDARGGVGGLWGRFGGFPNFFGGFGGGGGGDGAADAVRRAMQQAVFEGGGPGGAAAFHLGIGGMHHPPGPTIEEQWRDITFKPREKPLAGYTFDFDKEDKPKVEIISLDGTGESFGSSSNMGLDLDKEPEKKLSLVCCSCMAPLRVSQGQRTKDDRVVALQCGHLIDERCLNELSKPKLQTIGHPPGFIPVILEHTIENAQASGSTTPISNIRIRTRKPSLVDLATSPVQGNPSSLEPSSSRRLTRAAHAALPPDDDNATLTEAVDTMASPGDLKRKRGKQMSQWAMKKIKVPKESRVHTWKCPVPGCGREHTSHEIGGVWETKKDSVVKLFV